jgi:large subunit ribosomal protein L23
MKDYTEIIIAPVITEKSAVQAENNVYTFKVAANANKIEIKKAIEAAYGVKVVKVNTLNTKSKTKRVGRYTGKTQTYKKAFITLADGDKIEL